MSVLSLFEHFVRDVRCSVLRRRWGEGVTGDRFKSVEMVQVSVVSVLSLFECLFESSVALDGGGEGGEGGSQVSV